MDHNDHSEKRGYILLEGGKEFFGQMSKPDKKAILLAGGENAHLSIIPTAIAMDGRHHFVSRYAYCWFRGLGIHKITIPKITNKASANDPGLVSQLQFSNLIYFVGGYPHYIRRSLIDTECQKMVLRAYSNGAVIAGSSAGAMILCEYFYDPDTKSIQNGFGLIQNSCIIPHHNGIGKSWIPDAEKLLPGFFIIGIDEQTGMLNDGKNGEWSVYGKGKVSLYRDGLSKTFGENEQFTL